MTGFSRVPAPVGTSEYRAVGAGRVLAPNAQAKDLSKAAGKSGLAAAGFADEEQWPQPDGGTADEIGERQVNDIPCVGEFEDQRSAHADAAAAPRPAARRR